MKKYTVIMPTHTAAIHWLVFQYASVLPGLSPQVRARAADLARQYQALAQGKASTENIGAEHDAMIAAELQELPLGTAPETVCIRADWLTRKGEPLADGKPATFEAPTTWGLVEAVKAAGRKLPPGSGQWLYQAEPGDQIHYLDERSQTVVRIKIYQLSQ